MPYDVGDTEVLTARFTDDTGALVDPATVALSVTPPDGVTVGAAVTNPSVGVYEATLLLTLAGVWRYTWTSTGDAQVESGALVVGGPADPAPWIDAADVFSGTPCSSIVEADRDYAIAHRSARVASYVLWALSGRQYPGVFTDTIRPCRQTYAVDPSWRDRVEAGWWSYDRPWGTCGCGVEDRCGCGGLPAIRLPGGPAILGIFEVLVDGAVLDPSAYRVDETERLVRVDGDVWPCCQDLSEPTTETDTWSVTYAFGREPPEAGRQAARDLACELYRGATGGDCALPKRVSTITRQGVTLAVLDAFSFLDKGRTGLYSVDLFLAAVNPKGRMRRSVVASPDVGSAGVRTDT